MERHIEENRIVLGCHRSKISRMFCQDYELRCLLQRTEGIFQKRAQMRNKRRIIPKGNACDRGRADGGSQSAELFLHFVPILLFPFSPRTSRDSISPPGKSTSIKPIGRAIGIERWPIPQHNAVEASMNLEYGPNGLL